MINNIFAPISTNVDSKQITAASKPAINEKVPSSKEEEKDKYQADNNAIYQHTSPLDKPLLDDKIPAHIRKILKDSQIIGEIKHYGVKDGSILGTNGVALIKDGKLIHQIKVDQIGEIYSYDTETGEVRGTNGVALIKDGQLFHQTELDRIGPIYSYDTETGEVTGSQGVALIEDCKLIHQTELDQIGTIYSYDTKTGEVKGSKGVALIKDGKLTTGKIISNNEIALIKDGKLIHQTKVDKIGEIKHYNAITGGVLGSEGVALIKAGKLILQKKLTQIGRIDSYNAITGEVRGSQGVALIRDGKLIYKMKLDKIGEIYHFNVDTGEVEGSKGVALIRDDKLIYQYPVTISELKNKIPSLRYINPSGSIHAKHGSVGMLDLSHGLDAKNLRWKVPPSEAAVIKEYKPMGHSFTTAEEMRAVIEMRALFDKVDSKHHPDYPKLMKKLAGKPLALIIHADEDNNDGAPVAFNNNYKLQEKYNVLQFGSVKKDTDLYKILDKLVMLGLKPAIFELFGHGGPNELSLGGQDPAEESKRDKSQDIDKGDLNKLKQYGGLFKNTSMLINSCLNGEGGAKADNIANMYKKAFPQAAHIYTMKDSNNLDWSFDKQGYVNGVVDKFGQYNSKETVYDPIVDKV